MEIFINGKNDKLSKKEVRHAIKFFAEKLMRSDLLESLEITIQFEPINDYKAGCTYLDNNIRPREFDINVDSKMSRWAQIKALAHEMVHVRQYARGDLQDYVTPKKANKVKWKGKAIKSTEEWEDYWMSPWEIEAYGLEVGLSETYRIHLQKNK